MSKPWISDGRQRRSAAYIAVIRGLETGEPVEHLTRLVSVPSFTVTTSCDTDKITRKRTRAMDWKLHGPE